MTDKEQSPLVQFSLAIKKASVDPKTGERRWRADTSDIETDSQGDSMSMELFNDFVQRIESGEQPPAEYCSDFWSGGEPYVSVSHYPDLDGEAAAGISEKTYVDGKFLKARGRFFNNRVGDAAWKTVKYELNHKSEVENPVRISIAFLDYQHQHKSTGTIFTRSENDPICIECLKAQLKREPSPKTYLQGQLIHYAMTRVPVNQRTLMEADMTTRLEDAQSIVGKALAEELEEKSSLVGKAELVIKAEDEEVAPEPEAVVEEVAPQTDPVLDAIASMKAEFANLTSTLSEIVKAMSKKEEKPVEDDEEEEDDDMEEEKMCDKKGKKAMKSETVEEVPQVDMIVALSEAFASAMQPTNQKLDILIAAQSQPNKANVQVPQRRSLAPTDLPVQRADYDPNKPMSISDFARKSVGLS